VLTHHAAQPPGHTSDRRVRNRPGHASPRTIPWCPLAVLAFPVTSMESKMSPMTSGNGKLSLARGGGLTSWEETGTRMRCHGSVPEYRGGCPTAEPRGAHGGSSSPAVRPRALPCQGTAACAAPADGAHFHEGGSCCSKSREPGDMKFVFSGAKGHSTNEVYMSSHGATERHVSRLCRPARERNRDKGHSDAGRS